MRFRIKVRDSSGYEAWEEEEREIGPQKMIRGYGQQPDFTGDINQWGRDITEWFNKDESPRNHRTFLGAEMLP